MVFNKKLLMLCVSALAFLETQAATYVHNSHEFRVALAAGAQDIVMENGVYTSEASATQADYSVGTGGFTVVTGTQKIRARNHGKVQIVCGNPCEGIVSGFGIGLNVKAYAVYISNGISIHGCSTGVWVHKDAYANLNQVSLFANNNPTYFEIGAGMHLDGGSVAVVKNSVIRDNMGSGGIYAYGNISVYDSVITRNAAVGIRLRYPPCIAKVYTSQVVENYGGGVLLTEASNVKIYSSNISHNTDGADGSGVGALGGTIYIDKSTIKYNTGKPAGTKRAHGGVAMQPETKPDYASLTPKVTIIDSVVDYNTVLDVNGDNTELNIDVNEFPSPATVFTITKSQITAIAPVATLSDDDYETRNYCCEPATTTDYPTHMVCSYPYTVCV